MATIGVPVVSIDSESKITFHEETLRRIVTNERTKDLPVCVFSIAGPPGNGKSLILDFFLRYIRLRFRSENDMTYYAQPNTGVSLANWINFDESPLERSSWTSGVTNGILIWPEVFVCRAMDRSRIAVVFLETHGAFEEADDNWKWMNMFILSTLMSSTQIVNVGTEFKPEHVKLLDVFFGYGQQLREETRKQPLQRLHFVVRNWNDTRKADFGSWGGYNLLRNMISSSGKSSLKDIPVVKRIQTTFLEVGCYLMPDPGLVNFDSSEPVVLKNLAAKFLDHMNEFVRLFVGPGTITNKEVSGVRLLTRDLAIYFGCYLSEAFNTSEIPSTSKIYSATCKASHAVAQDEAVRLYALHMHWLCSGYWGLRTSQLLVEHKENKDLAVSHFLNKTKLGGQPLTSLYISQIEDAFESIFKGCARRNWMTRMKYHVFYRATMILAVGVLIFTIIYAILYALRMPDSKSLTTTQLTAALFMSCLYLLHV